MPGAQIEMTLEMLVNATGGIDEQTARIVLENSAQLKMDQPGLYGCRASLEGDDIAIIYKIGTNTYDGCKDINHEDTICRLLAGFSHGTPWVSSPSLHRDPRSSLDEF